MGDGRFVDPKSRTPREAALHGLEMQKQRLEDHIAQVKSMLGKRLAQALDNGSHWFGCRHGSFEK